MIHLPLPEALFVLGHDEDGRPRHHPTMLDIVLAGALLAELTITGTLVLDDGHPKVAAEPTDGRELLRSTARILATSGGRHGLADWLGRIATNATARTGDSLEAAGLCQRQSGRRFGLFRTTRVQFHDPDLLPHTEAWFNNALVWAGHLEPTDAVLVSLGRELGMTPPAYGDLTDDDRRRRRQLISAAMDDQIHTIIAATHGLITVAALSSYG